MDYSALEKNSYLLQYLNEIENGNILVGNELYTELKNLQDDIKHDDDYIFMPERARLRLAFIEGVCCLTKAPFYGQPMKLMLWQKAFIETIYSFVSAKHLKDENEYIDRFIRVLLEIGRKNGKTEVNSGLGISEWTLGAKGEQIVCASMNDENAGLAFDAMDTMRVLFDPKSRDTRRNRKGLRNLVTDSLIFKMSDEQKHIDGKNIDFALIDEVHELKKIDLLRLLNNPNRLRKIQN